jgi:hypothetical protein
VVAIYTIVLSIRNSTLPYIVNVLYSYKNLYSPKHHKGGFGGLVVSMLPSGTQVRSDGMAGDWEGHIR